MSNFYYWIPGKRSVSVPELVDAGLGYAVEDTRTERGCGKGPDGNNGVCVCHGTNSDGRLGYWPDKQTWRQMPGSELWCGMYSDDPPGPNDLARADQITGEWLTLDDGNKWLAPMARRWIEVEDKLYWDHNFPRRLTLNPEGLWVPGDVKPKYARLWELAMLYEDSYEAAAAVAPDDEIVRWEFLEIDTLAIGALQINYRIGPIELDLLGIYDSMARMRVIDVLLDNRTRSNWTKKKLAEQDHAGSSS